MSESHRCDFLPNDGADFEPEWLSTLGNCSVPLPLGEEKIPSPPRPRRSRGSGITKDKAELYSNRLGLRLRSPAWLYRRTWGERSHGGFKVTGHGWTAAERPASVHTIWSGLRGGFGVSLGEQAQVRLIVLDLDHGHNVEDDEAFSFGPPAVCTCGQRYGDAVEWRCECPQPDTRRQERAARELSLRQQIASKARPILAKLRSTFPAVEFTTFSTPRGCHVVFLLDEPLPSDEAQELGERILNAVDADRSEAFPKNGRLCRLPGTGSASRMLDHTLERRRHGSRLKDIEALLALRPCRPSDFGAAPKKARKLAPRQESTRVDSSPTAKNKPARTRAGESASDADLRNALAEKLSGARYEAAMLEVYRRGMPDDTSYDCMRKLAFLTAVSAGLARAECVRVAEAFIALPNHRATHTQTVRGRKQLLAVFRSCLKHQQRGIASSRIKPAQLARPALRKMLHDLLGRRPRLRVTRALSATTRQALSDAGRKRWAKDAA